MKHPVSFATFFMGARSVNGTGPPEILLHRRPIHRQSRWLLSQPDRTSMELKLYGGLQTQLTHQRSSIPQAAFERSEEHTSELQSLMRISYAVFCLKNKNPILEHTLHYTPTSP